MLALTDMTPPMQERVVCSITAAVKYHVPANIVLAVAEKEAGKPNTWVRNSNNTYDIGPMQFNTSYLRDLAKYGITARDVAAGGCYSFELAAWRLRGHITHDKGDLWTRVANYHSRTHKYNTVYRNDLMRKAAKWAKWLEKYFVTVEINDTLRSISRATQQLSQPKPLTGYIPRTITFSDAKNGQ